MTMTQRPALVLNTDFRSMSCFPLSLLAGQDAAQAVFGDRVAVVPSTMPSARIRPDICTRVGWMTSTGTPGLRPNVVS
jgi:hypothetical protein